MTVTLSQVGQASSVTAFSSFSTNFGVPAIILSPSTPTLLFTYETTSGYIATGVLNGTTGFNVISTTAQVGIATYLPVKIWFLNAMVIGGANVLPNLTNCPYISWFGFYNFSTNSLTVLCGNSVITNQGLFLTDIALDFANQYAYFWFVAGVANSGFIYRVPFSGLSSLVSQYKFPSSTTYAWIEVPNSPSTYDLAYSNLVYYNGNFYIVHSEQYQYINVWVVGLSSITWSSSPPSSAQSVGTLYTIFSGSSANVSFPIGFLNYYTSSGSVVYEILIYFIYNGSVYIYSFNPSNNTSTQLFTSSSIPAGRYAINVGGIIAFPVSISNSSGQVTGYAVGVYDRKTNSYEQTSALSNLIGFTVAHPYYALAISGSASSMTITVYRILVDTTPAFQNVSYSSGVLSGQLINLNGNTPLSGVTVYLYKLASEGDEYNSGTLVTSTTTDSNGNFSFNISNPGYYVIDYIA